MKTIRIIHEATQQDYIINCRHLIKLKDLKSALKKIIKTSFDLYYNCYELTDGINWFLLDWFPNNCTLKLVLRRFNNISKTIEFSSTHLDGYQESTNSTLHDYNVRTSIKQHEPRNYKFWSRGFGRNHTIERLLYFSKLNRGMFGSMIYNLRSKSLKKCFGQSKIFNEQRILLTNWLNENKKEHNEKVFIDRYNVNQMSKLKIEAYFLDILECALVKNPNVSDIFEIIEYLKDICGPFRFLKSTCYDFDIWLLKMLKKQLVQQMEYVADYENYAPDDTQLISDLHQILVLHSEIIDIIETNLRNKQNLTEFCPYLLKKKVEIRMTNNIFMCFNRYIRNKETYFETLVQRIL